MLDQQLNQEDVPFGYQSGPNLALVIKEPEATVVRELFQAQADKTTQKRVFIYTRLAQEDDQRMEEQVKTCFDFCQEKGYRGVDIFQECGSGNTLDREALTRMRERYKKGEVDGVIIMDPTRLARNFDLYHALREEMQEYKVEIIPVHQ
jgi:predicted site-specific integrase-resolvase